MTVAIFRKKPVAVEALQYTHENAHLFAQWMGMQPLFTAEDTMNILTLEGTMAASYGDWIIKGVHGEFYPCKPDIFELTYEYVGLAEAE